MPSIWLSLLCQTTFLLLLLPPFSLHNLGLIKYQYPTDINIMGDGPRGIQVFEDHFKASTSGEDSMQSPTMSKYIGSNDSLRSISRSWTRRKLKGAASMLNMFSLSKLPWMSGTDGQEKVELTAAEVEALRSELSVLEEREAHFKAQLEHIDEVIRAARLSGYLDMRMRWATLPGEPLPVDDIDVDDWLPRFFVLQGSCIFWYSSCTDLSPQDSTLLSDVVEVGTLPCLIRDNEDKRYCFYISTRYGLKYECSSISKIKVDSWLEALRSDCKLLSD